MHLDTIMTAVYRRIILPYIFRKTAKDPEDAHDWVLARLARDSHVPEKLERLRKLFKPISDPVTVAGITFPNRVGLAAGYDKNAVAVPAFAAMGFGFVVVGTVTRDQQDGNQRPRQWRLARDEALVNAMGFNNDGVEAVAQRLRCLRELAIPIWVSIGKSKNTPNEQAAREYYELILNLGPYADVVEVNVTSPNTPGLRNLLEPEPLGEILQAVDDANRRLSGDNVLKRVVLKHSPDSSPRQIAKQIEVALDNGVVGFTDTNTTVKRNQLYLRSPSVPESGGLSGRPLFKYALEVVKHVSRTTNGRVPIIAVGGIMSADDAKRMIDAGASLVQTFTGLVYNGPWFARTLARELKKG